MKIRAVSDLHVDINRRAPLHIDDDMFTIVAGDVSGNPDEIVKWVKSNLKHGAFVSGNHDVYDADMPIEDIKQMLAREFPASNDVTYFDNDIGVVSKQIDDNVILVADVMYTDYKLNVWTGKVDDNAVKANISYADPWLNMRGGMNDFNHGKTRKVYPGRNDSTYKTGRLVPEFYAEHFAKAFDAINNVVESNKDKDIILMTHHCLSPRCIAGDYVDDRLNASYVSDKTEWLHAHPNIKIVVSGHVHEPKFFTEGTAKYILNPLGYYTYYDFKGKDTFKFDDVIIDTSDWSVENVKDGLVCSKV